MKGLHFGKQAQRIVAGQAVRTKAEGDACLFEPPPREGPVVKKGVAARAVDHMPIARGLRKEGNIFLIEFVGVSEQPAGADEPVGDGI